jgi:hypothetical protein
LSTIASRRVIAIVGALALVIGAVNTSGAGRRFFDDDPISREPETQDASKVQAWSIDVIVDLFVNLFTRPGDPTPDVRARNINTIDEVPDSSWFVNRIVARPIALEELSRGPLTGEGPAPGPWTVAAPKGEGAAPGFTMRDARNELWFVSFDAKGHPEAATGAIAVATRIFWALGYWQPENHLVAVSRDRLTIAETAIVTPVSGRKRRMRTGDLDEVFARAHRSPDGTYRAIASRALPGRVVGPFYYHGRRPDDPNDIVPHEHRRELRALKVFGAWTNLVDLKAGNTLDTVVPEGGRQVVRHYLQDVGSTFGAGANGPHEYFEGWEYLHERELARKRLWRLGFVFAPWQTTRYEEVQSVGRFESRDFDPRTWRPRAPTAAFLRARPDDDFWATRRVAAFTDDMIRTAVREGRYSDPQAETLIARVLIERKRKVVAAFLPAVNPLIDFTLSAGGRLTFRNAAVDAGVAPAPEQGYRASWARFDNLTGESGPLGADTQTREVSMDAPVSLPSAPGAFVRVLVSAVEPAPLAWTTPVSVYFRRAASGWTLVGLERN